MAERITVTIETGTSAFDAAPATEIARMLRAAAGDFERDGGPYGSGSLFDSNGIKAGHVKVQRMRE